MTWICSDDRHALPISAGISAWPLFAVVSPITAFEASRSFDQNISLSSDRTRFGRREGSAQPIGAFDGDTASPGKPSAGGVLAGIP